MKQPRSRNEDKRRREVRKYRETASAAFPLGACPERFLSLSKGEPKVQPKEAAKFLSDQLSEAKVGVEGPLR